MRSFTLADTEATEALGAALARCLDGGLTVHLLGNLGAGKTTLVRGLLRALGHTGAVKSPTYTLVEPYELADRRLFHFDLYRLVDPEELEYVGIRDYLDGASVVLVEWPERAGALLPPPDLELRLDYLPDGRQAELRPLSPAGEAVAVCAVPPERT